MVERWQIVFRAGIARHLGTAGLLALRDALAADSPALIQGATTSPPALECNLNLPADGCCALGLALKADHTLYTVGDVENAFAVLVELADEALGEPAAIRHFLNWADEADRGTLRRELLAEVNLALAGRGQLPDQPAA